MSAMADGSPLDKLPDILAGAVRPLPHAATRVTRASEPRWTSPHGVGELNYLRSIKLTQKLFAVDQKKKKFLFIFHSDPLRHVLMDVLIEMNVVPVSSPTPAVAEPANVWEVRYPAFLLRNLSAVDASRYGPDGATLSNTLFLGLGNHATDIFAVQLDARPPRWRYSRGGIPGIVEPVNKTYSVAPIVDLTNSILAANSAPSSLPPALIQPRSTNTALGKTMDIALQGYHAAAGTLATATPNTLAEWFQKHFVLRDYHASMNLRLNAKGAPAKDEKDEQYLVSARLSVSTPEQQMARIQISAGDWLVPAQQQGVFFDALRSSDAVKLRGAIAQLLRIDKTAVPQFIESAMNGSIFLRCNRGESSSAFLMVLNGTTNGNKASVLLSANFRGRENPELDTESNAQVALLRNTATDTLASDNKTLDDFFQFLRHVRVWAGLL